MGRPRTIDNEEILDAAREIFLKRGAVATTAEVARRVGISQASIFKRFATKQELFLAAMVTGRFRQDLLEVFRRRTRDAGIRRALCELGQKLIPFFRDALPLVLLSWSNRGEFGFPKQLVSGGFPPAQTARELVAFIGDEMKAGRLRKQDPWLVTRAFVGALQNYVLLEIVTQGAVVMGPAWGPDAYVKGIVDVLWTGIAPNRSKGKFETFSRRIRESPSDSESTSRTRTRLSRSHGRSQRAPNHLNAFNLAAGRKPEGG